MHGQLEAEHGLRIMASDTPSFMEAATHGGFSLALNGDDRELLTSYYEQLSADGTIVEPLTLAPWGDTFGMFVDKFGINWMVSIAGAPTNPGE